jgi:tetrapyrrole methylase family protein/MazG family protein
MLESSDGAASCRHRAEDLPVTAQRDRRITVIGLGPGDPRHVTLAAHDALSQASEVWIRTEKHPARAALPPGLLVHTCDDLYETAESFDEVYRAIARRLVEACEAGPVLYAVPGDPSTGEATVAYLRAAAEEAGAAVDVMPGVSFVGPTLDALGWDALDGLQLADATSMVLRHHPELDPDRPALVAQVYSRLVASDLKLLLLDAYPPEHPVALVSGAGSPGARKTSMPLEELDRRDSFDDLTTLAVPPLPYPGSLLSLAEVVAHLRAPDGCPWDREQTHESLRPYLLEETYEVLDALDGGDDAAISEEMGDLLLQIVLHAQLASEDGAFTLSAVVRNITEKIVRRHPHVFGDVEAETSDEVRVVWEELKRAERRDKGEPADPFAGIPRAMPALARAQTVQLKGASAIGVEDEPADSALQGLSKPPSSGEARARVVGEALWAVVTVARTWGVDAESALREATARYQEHQAAALAANPGE